MRILFAGTPEVAVPSLTAIAASGHEVVAVLTRPDARAGRGRHQTRSPIARWADDVGVPVLQPARVNTPEVIAELKALDLDCAAVVAYGALIGAEALAVPRLGWVNLHFSLLPAWRGAAPVQHAIIAGDDVTGASTFRLEAGLDTGPVYGTLTETVRPTDTAGDLLARLAEAGAPLLVATLDGLASDRLDPVAQASDGVSLAPKLTPDDARVRWQAPAVAVDRRIRGVTPEPGAWTSWRGQRLGIGPLIGTSPGAADLPSGGLAPGVLAVTKTTVYVGTATTALALGEVRPAGKRAMPAADWARGVRPEPGESFDAEPESAATHVRRERS